MKQRRFNCTFPSWLYLSRIVFILAAMSSLDDICNCKILVPGTTTTTTTRIITSVSATKITWHAAPDTSGTTGTSGSEQDSRAKTAPKSQRYWDEHGIVRPDYAKTDEEIRREKREEQRNKKRNQEEGGSLSYDYYSFWNRVLAFLLVGMVAGMGFGWYYVRSYATMGVRSGGERLGTSTSNSKGANENQNKLYYIVLTWFCQVLGGGSENNANAADALDKARLARLARFEQTQTNNKAD